MKESFEVQPATLVVVPVIPFSRMSGLSSTTTEVHLTENDRSEVFYWVNVLGNFAKIIEERLRGTPLQLFSYKICEIFQIGYYQTPVWCTVTCPLFVSFSDLKKIVFAVLLQK